MDLGGLVIGDAVVGCGEGSEYGGCDLAVIQDSVISVPRYMFVAEV